MAKRFVAFAVVIVSALLSSCTCDSKGGLGFVLFVSERDGNSEIYRMNLNGTQQTNLTNNAALDYNPSLRRDGKRIAFASDRSGSYEIWTMNIDGSDVTQVTTWAGTGQNYHPAWNPAGTRIAYIDNSEIVDGGSVPYDIAVINPDGTGYVNLTNSPETDIHPAWSPDGTKIAWSRRTGALFQIWIMDADGSNQQQLTFAADDCRRPSFAPDGRIVFWTDSVLDGGATRTLYIMNADGSNITQIDVGSVDNWAPAVSRGGSRLFFSSTRDGNQEVYSSNMDGSNPTNLTNNASDDRDVVTSVGR